MTLIVDEVRQEAINPGIQDEALIQRVITFRIVKERLNAP
jgi:hypothetical protein